MWSFSVPGLRQALLLAATLTLYACGSGGGGGSSSSSSPEEPAPPPGPPPVALTEPEAVRFLSQATFGPSNAAIDEVMGQGLEDWLLAQFDEPPSLHLQNVLAGFPADGIFYDENGVETAREAFPWRYRGEKNVIIVHPCDPRVGGSGVCPAQVPGVSGLSEGEASAALQGAGFGVSVVTTDTDDPAKDGAVVSVTPTGWQDPGTTITITVAVYTGGGDSDPGSGEGESDG